MCIRDRKTRSALIETANRGLEFDDARVEQKSALALCLAKVHDYSAQPSDTNFQRVLDQIGTSEDIIRDEPTSAAALFKLGEIIQLKSNQDHVTRYQDVVGSLLKNSEYEDIVSMGEFAHDAMMVGKVDFEKLSEDIFVDAVETCLLYTSRSPRDATLSRMPSSA